MKSLHFWLFALALFGCTMEPKYETPQPPVALQENTTERKEMQELTWQEYFVSPELQKVISTALENNRDVKIAALNAQSAWEIYGVQAAAVWPQIDLVGYRQRQSANISNNGITDIYYAGAMISNFEIDFFGRLRSLKKAELESYLATEEAGEISRLSVITQTASAYIQFISSKENLILATQNTEALGKSLNATKMRYAHGISSQQEVINAELALLSAQNDLQSIINDAESSKTALMLLMGVFDESAIPEAKLSDLKINESNLNLAVSTTLLNRPDIKQAEHSLKSANANIGAARANFFPAITLTTSYGFAGSDLSGLFSGSNRAWSFTPQVSLPVFTGGGNIARLKYAQFQRELYIEEYNRAIQSAFKEALDTLILRQTLAEQAALNTQASTKNLEAFKLAQLTFNQGQTNIIDLANARSNLIISEQTKNTILANYLSASANLFKTLGGKSGE